MVEQASLGNYDRNRVEALEREVEHLKAAIKETWHFVSYNLPVSLEIEIEQQASLKAVEYNPRTFEYLQEITLNAGLEIMQETNEPVHYSVIVERVKHKHQDFLSKFWTRQQLGDKASLDGKVRDLASKGLLIRVGEGMYFYGPELKKRLRK